ncbi:hypothetical protein MYU51_011815 [Penicillium brevicompactum]
MSFNSIKLALLVGICGAVPFKKDGSEIVLGDVIISETIVELDYGRQYPGSFKRKDALLDVHGRPNDDILGLLQRLKIPNIIETLRRGSMGHLRWLLQHLDIAYPGASQDMLFPSDYIHKHRGNCIECCDALGNVCQSALTASCSDISCHENQLLARLRLEEIVKAGIQSPQPHIHIGSIGTGNAVMKSAQHRDQHAHSENIIAFEMEGVGVWDKFSCLVIKGVCDYADSHKSKVWQDYAAAAAAAVAKEVLGQYVMPQKVPQPMVSNVDSRHWLKWEPFPRQNRDVFRDAYGTHDSTSRQISHRAFNDIRGSFEDEKRDKEARQRILESLRFPQMQERAQQIQPAEEKTYEWILHRHVTQRHRYEGLVTWLSSITETRRIYWISGKPGSGKSTLMRFLEERLEMQDHMFPWARDCSVIRVSYFSWNSGNALQKSLEGLLRSLLFQILEQKPNLIPGMFDGTRWSAAHMPSAKLAGWTNSELLASLQMCILTLQKLSMKILFFVDGLDEFECTDRMRQELIDILTRMAHSANVKMFLSARPWNIFQDGFRDNPRLRLEDLTRGDITLYVERKFLNSPRFLDLLCYDQEKAEELISRITERAQGVFLWVRLVVYDLLQGIRDGDGIQCLHQKLEGIPTDLDEYLERLFSSISPQHKREASIILQVALHEERSFETLHPLRLLDLSFIDEPSPDFALVDTSSYLKLPMRDPERLRLRLDATLRRINSRCMGLLECTYNPDDFFGLFGEQSTEESRDIISHCQDLKLEPSVYPSTFHGLNTLQYFMLTVDFLHRCCRDFLISSNTRELLHQYSGGQYDARMFIVNARISQFLALQKIESGRGISLGLASYLISALSVPEWRETAASIRAAQILQPIIEDFPCSGETYLRGWYIGPSLTSWYEEESNFLTLAIDFNMRGYYMAHLTEKVINSKTGRPILDYVLRPRFESTDLRIGNSVPSVDLLDRVLTLGADPNRLYQGVSVWALFLSSVAEWLHRGIDTSDTNKKAYFAAIRMMIQRGAAVILPRYWAMRERPLRIRPFERLILQNDEHVCWPINLPGYEPIDRLLQPGFAVIDLLKKFRVHFGPNTNDLIALANARIDGCCQPNITSA